MHDFWLRNRYYNEPYQQYTTAQLLVRQSQGKFLTRDEKKRVTLHAEQQRKKNKNKFVKSK